MLDNILKTIDDKAKKEIDTILKQKEEAILALEEEHKKNLTERHEGKKKEFTSRIQAEIEEFRQQEQQKASFRLQAERNKIVEAVYNSAKSKVAELNDRDFKGIIKQLLNYLPEGIEGEISAGKRTAATLNGMFSLNCSVRADLDEEGIVFRSKDMEVDLRISQILKQNREITVPQVIRLLFSW